MTTAHINLNSPQICIKVVLIYSCSSLYSGNWGQNSWRVPEFIDVQVPYTRTPPPYPQGSASAEFCQWLIESKDAEPMNREGQLYHSIWVLNQFDIFLYDALGLFETMVLPNHSSYLAFTCVHICSHVHTHTHTHTHTSLPLLPASVSIRYF